MREATGRRGLGLRAGDWVEVRSRDEILGTLDGKGCLQGMPFMPEMLAYCGRRLRVAKSAHKTCDTISGAQSSRRVEGAVHLEGVRCNGQAHGGCDAACSVFWKEAWVRRADAAAGEPPPPEAAGCTLEDLAAAARGAGGADGADPTWACQATELVRASAYLPWWDVRQYVEDVRSGNASVRQLGSVLAYFAAWRLIRLARRSRTGAARILVWMYDRFQAWMGGVPFPRKKGRIALGENTPYANLDLRPGELVRVKSYDEILSTLDGASRNRGLYFDAEQVPYCGKVFRVRSRVNRIIDERTGRMLEFKSGSVILEGATCQACYSDRRALCPRELYPYWREIWLERVATDAAGPPYSVGDPIPRAGSAREGEA